jgi:branched-chain amino acid transport system substrate-binding protein
VLQANGYTVIDPGRYQNLTDDFSAQLNEFKSKNVEIVTGVMIPPDFTTFWTQAAQQGFKPKAATVGKALLFPVAIEALGPEAGHNLSTEVWWTPSHPFASSLTQQSAADLGKAYEDASGKQWTQPLGFAHALFEIAVDVFKRAQDLDDPAAIRDAIAATELDTIVGKVSWKQGPVKNVAKTPLVGGQWRKGGGKHPYELVVVDNQTASAIPTQGVIEPIA